MAPPKSPKEEVPEEVRKAREALLKKNAAGVRFRVGREWMGRD